jgi:large subunit ribosomal protein L17
MQHRRVGRKFHRLKGQRVAFIRGLASNLIRAGRIETTVTRAKEIRPIVEKMVTIARKGDLASRRLLISKLANSETARRLVEDIAPRYVERPGGYLRIQQLMGARKRDGATRAIIEFV